MCPEPKGVWTIRISPDGVKDLGHRFLDPEIQWADELLSRIAKGKNTDDLAELNVVTAVKAQIKKVKAEFAAVGLSSHDFSWGLLDGYNIIERGQEGTFEVDTNEGQMRFSYVMRNGKPYFTNIRIN
jgi:O-phosphoseryl-tRNA(Cys) synthetase